MNKTITITVIALVAVVMGMSAIAPMIPYAEASPGELPQAACDALKSIPNPPEAIQQLIEERCDIGCPPNCGGAALSVEVRIF